MYCIIKDTSMCTIEKCWQKDRIMSCQETAHFTYLDEWFQCSSSEIILKTFHVKLISFFWFRINANDSEVIKTFAFAFVFDLDDLYGLRLWTYRAIFLIETIRIPLESYRLIMRIFTDLIFCFRLQSYEEKMLIRIWVRFVLVNIALKFKIIKY